MGEAISEAQSSKNWRGDPTNLEAQALAIEPGMRLSSNLVEAMRGSEVFKSALPFEKQLEMGLIVDDRDFDLGATTLANDSLYIVRALDGHLADRIGLKNGDRIASAGGAVFQSLWDFKLFVRERVGTKTKVTVQREGKLREIELKIPDTLP
jgi:C-terminal processing protease CtpA/Prc